MNKKALFTIEAFISIALILAVVLSQIPNKHYTLEKTMITHKIHDLLIVWSTNETSIEEMKIDAEKMFDKNHYTIEINNQKNTESKKNIILEKSTIIQTQNTQLTISQK